VDQIKLDVRTVFTLVGFGASISFCVMVFLFFLFFYQFSAFIIVYLLTHHAVAWITGSLAAASLGWFGWEVTRVVLALRRKA